MLTAGLLAYTKSALTGGSSTSSSPSPSRVMCSARVAPGPQVIAPQGCPVQAEEAARVVVDAAARVAPVTGDAGNAGNRPHGHAAAAVTLNADADANAGRPGIGEPLAQLDDRFGREPGDRSRRAGGNSRIRWRNASQPKVCAPMNSRSSRPSVSTTCSRPSASAASVPGIGARCQSLAAAVRVRIGSMETTNAPFFRAWSIGRHR